MFHEEEALQAIIAGLRAHQYKGTIAYEDAVNVVSSILTGVPFHDENDSSSSSDSSTNN
jgi:hypothetical protein